MRKPHLLCVAPYEDMYNIMKQIAENCTDMIMSVYLGDMYEGLNIVQEHINDKIDIIISRGQTGELIANHFKIPVYNVTFSTYDILRAIQTARIFTGRFAVLGNQSITSGATLLCDMLQYSDVNIQSIHSLDQLEPMLDSLKRLGFDLIVGDRITTNTAQTFGMRTILITSCTNSIQLTIDRALNYYKYISSVQNVSQVYQSALTFMQHPIVIFDAQGNALFSSLSNNEVTLMQELLALLSETENGGISTFTRTSNKNYYKIRKQIVTIDDNKYTLFEIIKLSNFRPLSSAIQVQSYSDFGHMSDHLFWGSSKIITDFFDFALKCTKSVHPIAISGVGHHDNTDLAIYLYKQAKRYNSSFISLNCASISSKQLTLFLDSPNSPLYYEFATVFIYNINFLGQGNSNRLFSYLLDSSLCSRVQIILSLTPEDQSFSSLPSSLFSQFLRHCFMLTIPKIQQHPEDIVEISNLYLNRLNAKYGKQVIGLSAESSHFLENYSGFLEISDLKQLLRKVFFLTDTTYISLTTLKSQLPIEKPALGSPSVPQMDYTKTLKDIEYEIVKEMYTTGNITQTQIAKQLGISRSTLWRILKR